MNLIKNKKILCTGVSLALSLSFVLSAPVQAGVAFELFELVEGEASDSGYIPVYDPAESLTPEQNLKPAGDESSISPRDAVSDGQPFTGNLPDTQSNPFGDGETITGDEISPDVFSDGFSDFGIEPFTDEELPREETLYMASDLPSSYSLVDAGYGTSVKNQGSLGICWAFSALESIETGMIKRGLANNSVSLSESHLSYSAFHGTNSDEADPTGVETFLSLGEKWTRLGGNKLYSNATLSRGYGPAFDADFPLSLAETANFSDAAGSMNSILDSVITDDKKKTSVARLKNCYWLPEINPSGGALIAEERAKRVNVIKQFILNYGAVEAGIYTNSYAYPYDKNTNSFYCSQARTPNHSITLVGWDDYKETAAPVAGAFLMQNSWGASAGENGLFWISYEDCSLKSPSFYEMESQPVGKAPNIIISQYDGTGYGSVITPADPETVDSSFRMAGANVFVSDVSQYLKQVSFYAAARPLKYTIRVYRNVQSTPDTGTLVLTQSGSCAYMGYYTIDLGKQIPLAPGEKFAISLQFENSKGYIPHERSSKKLYTADHGQSYLFDGSSWIDMMDIYYRDSVTGNKEPYACNLCIKGIGVKSEKPISMGPSKPQYKSVKVVGGNRIDVTLKEQGEKNVAGYDFVIGTSPNFIKTKSYTKVNKNVKSPKTSFTYLPKGTYYLAVHSFRLNAKGEKVFSPWSDVNVVKITGTTPGTPKLKSVSAGKGSLTAVYTKASSATHYEYTLARKSFSAATYSPASRYKTWTNRKYANVNLKGLAKGTYYFGVRGYTLKGKTKVYGKWAVKKVTIK